MNTKPIAVLLAANAAALAALREEQAKLQAAYGLPKPK